MTKRDVCKQLEEINRTLIEMQRRLDSMSKKHDCDEGDGSNGAGELLFPEHVK